MPARLPVRVASLLSEVRSCTQCADVLPLGPRPVFQFGPSARLLIVGQAPGRRVHETGVPFNDPSGQRLRQWLGVTPEVFYDPARVALLPMGFCFPGTGPSGDLPPRPECAATWRARLLAELHAVELTVVIGQYALAWHLPGERGSLTEVVQRGVDGGWESGREIAQEGVMALPHPSPRNNRWLARNPWFEERVVPRLQARVAEVLGHG